MATPTLHTQVVGTNVTSVSFTNTTDVSVGDLLIVVWGASAHASTAITATATSGATTVATLQQDAKVEDPSNGPARDLYVFSGIVTTAPTSAVTITLTNAPGTGTRRLFVQSVSPGAGQRWMPTRPDRSGTVTGTAGGNPWTIGWGANATSNKAKYAVAAVQFAATQNPTIDPGDGTARTPTYPGASALFQILTIGYGTGTTLSTATSASISAGAASSHAAVVALYLAGIDSRANNASGASAKFSVTRRISARGNAAAKGTGAGQKTIGLRTASGRANAAAKASAIPHPKTASGRANAAAAAYMQDPYVIHTASGRANAAGRGAAHGLHGTNASGRANVAANAVGVGKHIVPITASGRANAAAKGTAHMFAPYHPTFLADFTNTLILANGSSSTVVADVGITITHVADDGHTTTLESQ